MTPQKEPGKSTRTTRRELPPGVGGNPFSELIAMILFTGPVDGCECQLCQLTRKAKLEMANQFLIGGKT